jgi:hypothetical protein
MLLDIKSGMFGMVTRTLDDEEEPSLEVLVDGLTVHALRKDCIPICD